MGMNQKPKSIFEFRKGDILTRLKPMSDEEGYKDFSLVGAKLTFIGIANACVYLSKKSDPLSKLFLGQDLIQIKLPLELCQEGWANYIEPDFGDGISIDTLTDEQAITAEIQKAVDEEDYFRAEALKKKLEEITKNKDKK
jgi:hypothetical protein